MISHSSARCQVVSHKHALLVSQHAANSNDGVARRRGKWRKADMVVVYWSTTMDDPTYTVTYLHI